MSDRIKPALIIGVATIVAAIAGAFIGRPVLNEVDGTSDRIEELVSQNRSLESDNQSLRNELAQVTERLGRVESLFTEGEGTEMEPTSNPSTLSSGAVLEAWLFNEENINQLPVGTPLSSAVDDGQAFSVDRFRLLPDRTLMDRKPVTLKWSGLVNLDQRGEYLFVSSLFVNNVQNGNGYGYNAYAKLTVSGETVLEDSFIRIRDGSDPSVVQGTIALNRGLHRVEVWLTASWVKYSGYGSQYNLDPTAVELGLFVRKPGSRENAPFRPEAFRHSQSR